MHPKSQPAALAPDGATLPREQEHRVSLVTRPPSPESLGFSDHRKRSLPPSSRPDRTQKLKGPERHCSLGQIPSLFRQSGDRNQGPLALQNFCTGKIAGLFRTAMETAASPHHTFTTAGEPSFAWLATDTCNCCSFTVAGRLK